jgi:hypothetical protein
MLNQVFAVVVRDLEDFVGHRVITDLPGTLIARPETFAVLVRPQPHRAAGGHARIGADVGQRTALGQFTENPVGDLGGVEGSATGLWADLLSPPITSREALAVVRRPLPHRAFRRHAWIAADVAQRTAA